MQDETRSQPWQLSVPEADFSVTALEGSPSKGDSGPPALPVQTAVAGKNCVVSISLPQAVSNRLHFPTSVTAESLTAQDAHTACTSAQLCRSAFHDCHTCLKCVDDKELMVGAQYLETLHYDQSAPCFGCMVRQGHGQCGKLLYLVAKKN